jgi:hypothetical protein
VRFGHLNFRALRTLTQQELVKGLPEIEQVDQLCTCCLVGKQRRAPFPRQAEHHAESVLDQVKNLS